MKLQRKFAMLKPALIISCLLLVNCGGGSKTVYAPIVPNPADLDYAKKVCNSRAELVGERVKQRVKASTTDIQGGGFYSGLSNGLQGTFEGAQARRDYFYSCMLDFGYEVK